jgi:hypothetical protein
MEKSLDEIITENANARKNNASRRKNNNRSNRVARSTEPYSRPNNKNINYSNISLKILVSNSLVSSLIGTKGSSIRELISVSGADIVVSNSNVFYHGTSDRVVDVSGELKSVALACRLIWTLKVINDEDESESWSPSASLRSSKYDDIEVEGLIAVPAKYGGVLIGKGGATMQSFIEETGCNVSMTSKEESIVTQERVLKLSGTSKSCSRCTSKILKKCLSVNNDNNANRKQVSREGERTNTLESIPSGDMSASSTITMQVSDELAGNIIGPKVSYFFLQFLYNLSRFYKFLHYRVQLLRKSCQFQVELKSQ